MRRPEAVYVVMGYTGEYSDQRSWPVAAYADEEMAKQHANAATERALKHERSTDRYSHEEGLKEAMGGFDPYAKMDYTGSDYGVLSVPFRTEVPDARS